MNIEELMERKELVESSQYAAIRKKAVDYIIANSSSTLPDDVIRGMLLLIKYIDGWKDEYEAALRKRKEQ